MNLKDCNINKSWTLFLDRDGVINKRLIDDYVKSWDEFEFLPGVKEAMKIFAGIFGRIIIVSNQQGVGKGLMSDEDVDKIHLLMKLEIESSGGRIDNMYFCPGLSENNPLCRKPNPGMAIQAKEDHPEIIFTKSIMAGDSFSDMEFGKNLEMLTVFLTEKPEMNSVVADLKFPDLLSFARSLKHLL